jgi:hypothetical protein
MAINVIQGGTVDSFDYLAFPSQNPMNTVYLENQLSNFSQSLTDIGRQFIETSKAIYEKVNDSNAIRIAKAALRMAKGIFHPNEIVSLTTIDEMRFAQPVMQRYIMAEPTVRTFFHKQQCDGYSSSYFDPEPTSIGKDHYDYRRVMSGIIVDEVDSEGNERWVSHNYYDEARDNEPELDFQEKVTILKTWNIAKMFIEAGQDPTDPFAAPSKK